jgi:Skp family chaperone for outer membrane proteins
MPVPRRAAALCVPIVLLAFALISGGCGTTRKAYYNAWEKFGYAKRERLVDNVKAARQEQVDAKKQFATALEQFKSVVNFSGGDLEGMYNKLNREYERSDAEAGRVRSKVQSVKNVAAALFDEWKGEIGQIQGDSTLQRKSQELYDRTRQSYGEMISRMDTAAASMDPVLTKFKNRVLFIKHNLNAQAIASLKGTEVELGGDIDRLIREMNASIQEADDFIRELEPKKS